MQVPWPPHVESMATRSSSPRRRSACRWARARPRRRARSAGERARAAVDGASTAAHDAAAASPLWRARCAAIQLAPQGSWPSSRSAARTLSTHTGARVHDRAGQPGGHRHRQEGRVEHVALRQAEGHVGRAERHVHAQLVADQRIVSSVVVDRVGVGADGHGQRVDDDVLGRDPVVARDARRSSSRSPAAAAASRGCRSRRWPGRSPRRRAAPPAAGSPRAARPRRSPSSPAPCPRRPPGRPRAPRSPRSRCTAGCRTRPGSS